MKIRCGKCGRTLNITEKKGFMGITQKAQCRKCGWQYDNLIPAKVDLRKLRYWL